MAPVVRLDIADRVATITLDSQSNRNALSRQLLEELHQSIDVAEADDARVIVLRHEGPAFCAGADLKERSEPGPTDSSPMVRAMQRLMYSERPTIAAVQGAVRAGGIGLMASCDLVVVGANVSFALTEVRVGVAPAIISVPILDRVPASKIAGPMLTGETFDAARALEMGLITHVSEDVDAAVAGLCAGVLTGAPHAVASTKRLLRRIPHLPIDDAFVEMQAFSEALFATAEAAEGMAAFKEKRPPDWS
jgi:enoyl-CoA hydratase/carnithine racemase